MHWREMSKVWKRGNTSSVIDGIAGRMGKWVMGVGKWRECGIECGGSNHI